MGLGRKNLFYSMALAGAMMLFLIGYFVCMLPSLYVDHVMEQNLKSIYEQHRAYRENGSYEEVRVKNATACFSVEIPWDGNYVLVAGKAFSAEIRLKEERLMQLLDRCRKKLEDGWHWNGERDSSGVPEQAVEDAFGLEEEMRELEEILKSVQEDRVPPLDVRLLYSGAVEDDFFNEAVKVHTYGEDLIIMEFSIEDTYNRYANYVAMEKTKNSLIISVLPVMAPDVGEIRPVVLGSLPMLGAVILLLVLLFSRMYSRGIVGPILRLVQHTQEMEQARDFEVRPLSAEWPDRKDEVRELADTLDDFYLQIREGYRQLEEKNRELAEENRRQEIFLRASSHQLKTPVAAALLLVEGMINEVGRYRDTKTYLPRVKEQLLSMRKMVEDILYLNHCGESGLRQADVAELLKERLRSYQVELADRGISAEISGAESLVLCTDEMMVTQILDNLLSNAVKYTPREGSVRIFLDVRGEGGAACIRIENSGVTIPRELLPHILEPFVSGSHENGSGAGSHGLGLYIASYYAKKLAIRLSVENGDNRVAAVLVFPPEMVS